MMKKCNAISFIQGSLVTVDETYRAPRRANARSFGDVSRKTLQAEGMTIRMDVFIEGMV